MLVVVIDASFKALHEDGHGRDVDTAEGRHFASLRGRSRGVTSQERGLVRVERQAQDVGQLAGGTTGLAFDGGITEAVRVGIVHDGELLLGVGFGGGCGIDAQEEADGHDQIRAFVDELLDVLGIIRLLLGFEVFGLATEFFDCTLGTGVGGGIEGLVIDTAEVSHLADRDLRRLVRRSSVGASVRASVWPRLGLLS